MSSLRFRLALPCAVLLLLGGCAAVPVAQLAVQAMATRTSAPGMAPNEVAQAPDIGGMGQAARGMQSMLQRVAGPLSGP